jgi:beta-N-acetylhexosaminidase
VRSRRAGTLVAVVVAAALVASACGGGGPNAPTPSGTTPIPSASPTQSSPSPTGSPTPALSCVEQVLSDMTEGQRVGQLFMIGLANSRLGPEETAAIRGQHFGSVTFVKTSTVGVDATRAVTDAVQALATTKATAGVGFLVGVNQEGGQIQALRGPGFSTIPTPVEQGTWSPATLRKEAATWGGELAAAGVNLNFAPVMDVVPAGTESQNQPIGVLQREYGNDPTTVATHGVAFLHGMQDAGVDPTAKHFPGLGRVEGNTDFAADVVDDVTTRDDPYLKPFRKAVDAGVPFVMVSEATYTRIDPDHLAVFSPTVITDMLRGDLGFTGVVVSDEIGDAEAAQDTPVADRGTDFLQAGGDLIVSKTVDPAVAMAKAIRSRAAADPAFAARVDDAVLHVLEAKDALGLLPCSG